MRINLSESSNPVISRVRNNYDSVSSYATETATFSGIASKTGILLGIIFAITAFIWLNFERFASVIYGMFILSAFTGFIFVLLAQFTRKKALFTILYAVSEGFMIGTLTYIVKSVLTGGEVLVYSAVAITFSIIGFLLIVYATGTFKVGFGFRKFVYTTMFGLVIGYFFLWIMSLFGLNIFNLMSPGVLIVITLVMVILAAFNLLIDFDDCKRVVNAGLTKEHEWVLSLGLLVSIVWLFVEVLRLLLILASRTDD